MIDFRSDTVTKPTDEMREAMFKAEVGDDVYGEDPTVNELEELAARMLGKEKAMFVTSGTQGNQIAVLTHGKPGAEIILEADSHIFYYEAGAVAALAGVQTRTIAGYRGQMPLLEIEKAIRSEDIHFPQTAMIGLENTHNRAGGAVLPPAYMEGVYKIAQQNNIPVHLDGARLFNAATALQLDVKNFTRYTDTVQICLSKGLSAPMGSLLAGSASFVSQARKWRKRLGGGMRQAGLMAAPGIIALTKMVDRLQEDHRRAKDLAEGLGKLAGLRVNPAEVETNIVLVDVEGLGLAAKDLLLKLKEHNILGSAFGEYLIRLTVHREINDNNIKEAIAVFSYLGGKYVQFQ